MENTEDYIIPITPEEEKQLRRVYELLCDYHIKKRIEEEVNVIRINHKLKPHDVVYMMSFSTLNAWYINVGVSGCSEGEMAILENLYHELEELKKIDLKNEKKISFTDICAMLKNLKLKINKKEIEEMIWEVDEDIDGMLGWTEFRLMFTRNIMDKSGLEPSRMFNLIQFLIYDNNANGKVSLDETMHMLYTRYGKRELETKLKEIFGPGASSPGLEGGDITFSFYVEAVEKVQTQMFWHSARGRITSLKGQQK